MIKNIQRIERILKKLKNLKILQTLRKFKVIPKNSIRLMEVKRNQWNSKELNNKIVKKIWKIKKFCRITKLQRIKFFLIEEFKD